MTFELEIIYANLLSYYNHATESTELFLQNYKIETAFYAALSSIEYNPYESVRVFMQQKMHAILKFEFFRNAFTIWNIYCIEGLKTKQETRIINNNGPC